MARTPSLGIFKQQKYKKITINDGKGQDGQGTPAGHLSPASTDGLANNAEAVLSFFSSKGSAEKAVKKASVENNVTKRNFFEKNIPGLL